MRNAFTIIELLVSIVVIGIALMSLPLAIEQSSKSGEVASLQDSYYKAYTLLKQISSKPWDAKSAALYLDGNNSLFLDVTNGDSMLARVGNARIGSFYADNTMRIFYPTETYASQISSGSQNSIDGFNGFTESVANTTLSVSVDYVPDTATRNNDIENVVWNISSGQSSQTNSTNLKRIKVVITKQNSKTPAANLAYFSSNIGSNSVALK